MFSTKPHRTPSREELRRFGLVLATGFFVIGVAPFVYRHAPSSRPALALSLVLACTGTVAPGLLRPVHRVWIGIGDILGWINSKIILSALFFGVVTPTKFLMMFAGTDPMNRTFDPQRETYRVVRKPRTISHMRHQF